MDATEKRKAEHIGRAMKDEADYEKSTLFEDIVFLHNALPELNFSDISLEVFFMGKRLKAPMIIEAMTGGYMGGKVINEELAVAAEEEGVAMGIGSQRAMVERAELKETYNVKRVAPELFLIGNIGAYQLKKYSTEQIEGLVSSLELDALAIHLNPLQEMVQPEGDKDWDGVLAAIERHAEKLDVPIIFKEVGAGLSPQVIGKLKGISPYFDIAGSGGTSWSRVEYLRGGQIDGFEEWGIPTALALLMAKHDHPNCHYIASGGLRSGIDGAKALAIGAEMFGAAKPFLLAQQGRLIKKLKGSAAVKEMIEQWKAQLRGVMFLTGFKDIESFRKGAKDWLLIKGQLKELYDEFLRL